MSDTLAHVAEIAAAPAGPTNNTRSRGRLIGGLSSASCCPRVRPAIGVPVGVLAETGHSDLRRLRPR